MDEIDRLLGIEIDEIEKEERDAEFEKDLWLNGLV